MMAIPKRSAEPIIDPALPIVDPHHHLWHLPPAAIKAMQPPDGPYWNMLNNNARYLLEDFLADANTGHNVRATVVCEANVMYRPTGPEEMKSVGEVEFIAGSAAMAESGIYGDMRVCAGIIGNADLHLGDAVEDILHAHINAGGGRYRGVRNLTSYDPDTNLRAYGGGTAPGVLLDQNFRAGFKWLQKLGLSYDAFLFEPQLPDLIDLARAFPETQMALDHLGTPLGVSSYDGKRDERFFVWRDNIRVLATCGNVAVKLGGLGMPILGFKALMSNPPATSEQLAAIWRPYIETCIDAFGAKRCMFESNYPVDSAGCTYPVLWNAFKRVVAGASKDEKTALFSGTATKLYRLNL